MPRLTPAEHRALLARMTSPKAEGGDSGRMSIDMLPITVAMPPGVMLCQISMPGEPVPKKRPRVVRRKGAVDDHIITFTPKETRRWERAVRERVVLIYPRLVTDTEHALGIRMHFACASNQRRDIDNLSKLVLDALNGLVWEDDVQVAELHATMAYASLSPRTEFIVWITGPRPTAVRKRRVSKVGTAVLSSRQGGSHDRI